MKRRLSSYMNYKENSVYLLETRWGLVTGFIWHLQKVTTNNYYNLTELHTPKIAVTTAHIKSSQSSLGVAW
jgi:hypothetical protein